MLAQGRRASLFPVISDSLMTSEREGDYELEEEERLRGAWGV